MPRLIFVNRFYSPDQSATSQMLTDLAEGLASTGCEVHVVACPMLSGDPGHRLPQYEVINRVHVHRISTSRFGRASLHGRLLDYLSFFWSAGWTLNRLVQTGDTLVAKTDPPLVSVLCAGVARMKGARFVNWLQDLFPELAVALGVPFVRGPFAALLRLLRNASLKAATMNIVIGESMRRHVIESGVPAAKVKVIQNWADETTLRPMLADQNVMRKVWRLQDAFIVGYAGNMGRAHDFSTILDAAKHLSHESRIRFLIVGDGKQRAFVEDAARARALTNVEFRPFQPRDRLREALCVPDVHIVSLLPELEGLIVPSKLYGILAVGRPVCFIGDKEGEVATKIRAASCGDCVQAGDGGSLAALLSDWMNSPHLVSSMGRNARLVSERKHARSLAWADWKDALGLKEDKG